jgi:hypothetical protein
MPLTRGGWRMDFAAPPRSYWDNAEQRFAHFCVGRVGHQTAETIIHALPAGDSLPYFGTSLKSWKERPQIRFISGSDIRSSPSCEWVNAFR